MSDAMSFTENWGFYNCSYKEFPLSVRLDMGAAGRSEEAAGDYPHTFLLDIRYERENENGMPGPKGLAQINKAEDSFCKDGLEIYLLGVVTGMGISRFVFCLGNQELDADQIAEKLLDGEKDLDMHVKLLKEDRFRFYFDFLFPNLMEFNWMRDFDLCSRLEQQGELFLDERIVDFCIYFKERLDADHYVEKLEGKGFRVQDFLQTDDGRWRLVLGRDMIPSMENINPLTSELLALAEETGSEFDGWGTVIN